MPVFTLFVVAVQCIVNVCQACVFVAVSRLHCESESFKMDLILDVNTQIYPVDLGMTILDRYCDVRYYDVAAQQYILRLSNDYFFF